MGRDRAWLWPVLFARLCNLLCGVRLMKNIDLKEKYEGMHDKGQASWTFRGNEERRAIMDMGRPWEGVKVLEIGCGEGDLAALMVMEGAEVRGIDYSTTAIGRAHEKYPTLEFSCTDYRQIADNRFGGYDRIVMQGVLEHLDSPFQELKWMIDNLLKKAAEDNVIRFETDPKPDNGDVITSSPGFLNPRGLIWMALHMVGAVMSKTDLHFLHPWQFEEFCKERGYFLSMRGCDHDWAWGNRMMIDFRKRINLALNDGQIPLRENDGIDKFLDWLERTARQLASFGEYEGMRKGLTGANIVYRIRP